MLILPDGIRIRDGYVAVFVVQVIPTFTPIACQSFLFKLNTYKKRIINRD